jgi:serine/threonine protein kinase
MTPNRWQRIEQIFQSALEMDLEERAAFLAKACADDHSLRSEVESLIAAHYQAGSFIASGELSASEETVLIEGQEVGHYKIVSLLGRGGMGEVYLAEDTRLGRKVALKLLPPGFTKDQDRVRRFQREARAASALNHPNIITIFDIGQSDDLHFIAAEFIDGPTLRALIGKEELSRLIELIAQVADGLAKAHSSGIVHRDLKPENIMVTKDGFAKVLDFGLAKLVEPALDGKGSEAATKPIEQTRPGLLIGTVGYMSPEQAQGREVDHRSDVFSFGCMLYEAVTARRPFEGDSTIEVLHRIVYEQPPAVSDFNRDCPAGLRQIIRKCLVKDPERRYQSIKDAAIDLREVIEECGDELSSSGARPARAATKEIIGKATLPEPALSDADPEVLRTTRFSRASVALTILGLIAAIMMWPADQKWLLNSEMRLECPKVVATNKAREVVNSLGYDATNFRERNLHFHSTSIDLGRISRESGLFETHRAIREGRAAAWKMILTKSPEIVGESSGAFKQGEFSIEIDNRGRLLSFETLPKETVEGGEIESGWRKCAAHTFDRSGRLSNRCRKKSLSSGAC